MSALALQERPALAEAHRLLRTKGRTFKLASWLLPRAARDDAAVVYAFCRRADDLADDDNDRAGLEQLSAELRAPKSPLMLDFVALAQRRNIPLQAAEHLIAGVAGDLTPRIMVADDGELVRYAYSVAGTVGLMMARLLDVSTDEALPHAIDLGVAMQLTNICRDVAEDARNGRVYLPRKRLELWGVTPERLLSQLETHVEVRHAAFIVVRELLVAAERYYESARAGLAALPLRTRRTALAAATLYRAIGLEVLSRGPDGLLGRATVGTWTRARLFLGAYREASRLRFRPHESELHEALRGLPGTNAPPLRRTASPSGPAPQSP